MIPSIANKKLKLQIPSVLESIIIIFIFAAQILGEIQNFYGIFTHWDTILHTINGVICAGIGFSMIDILNNNDKIKFSLSPIFISLVAFCFSMTIGVTWEFFEFGMDSLFQKDMQKDKIVSRISSVKLNNNNAPIVIDNIKKTIILYEDNNQINNIIIDNGYIDIGIIDTMKDLIVNFIGAFIFSIFGYLYLKNKDKYKMIEKCMITSNHLL